jgi:hypothetical protein
MASSGHRDVGLERIGTATRVLAVGAMMVGGLLSAAVAKALPGKSVHRANPAGISSRASTPTSPSGGQDGIGAPSTVAPLTAPAQAPQATSGPPVVASGGS